MNISVTTDNTDNGDTERGRMLGLEEFELAMRDDATPEQLDVLLVGLRQLRDRVDQHAQLNTYQQGLDACYLLNSCNDGPEYSMTCASVTVNAASVYECEGYRLPTEVEWEYAARAGARTPFFAGPMSNEVANDIGNCVQESALDDWDWYCFNTSDNRAQPVGKKGANAWGLHDTQGNVMEFVSNPSYTRLTPIPAVDPWGDIDVTLTMAVRGGNFSGLPDYSRLASRMDWRLGGDAGTGFRLVRTLED